MALPILWVGMEVHKDFVMIAVFRGRATTPLYLEKVSFDPNRLRRFFQRLADRGRDSILLRGERRRVCAPALAGNMVLRVRAHRSFTDPFQGR